MINQYVDKCFQWFLNAALILIGIVLAVMMVRELITIAQYAWHLQ